MIKYIIFNVPEMKRYRPMNVVDKLAIDVAYAMDFERSSTYNRDVREEASYNATKYENSCLLGIKPLSYRQTLASEFSHTNNMECSLGAIIDKVMSDSPVN